MCGITGFVGEGHQTDLEQMVSSLHHRGPDDRGVDWQPGVGLGQTRLSILDLSPLGHQPMYDQGKTLGVVFNGEIYNYLELKQELETKGYVFKSSSDTEVILYLYQEYGDSCFAKMNGMFAIAIYDFTKQQLTLVRDRLGKKPLYWSKIGGTVIFGSELKAILAHPLVEREIDPVSLNLYLFHEYVPTPRTIFKNIYKLSPGSIRIFNTETVTEKKFWQINQELNNISLSESVAKLDNYLDQAVARRLISDVPLGIFLSGGLDSSTIAYYAQKHSQVPIKTFSIGFQEASFDESIYAQKVADILGTDHHHKILSAQDSLKLIPRIADILDEPLADASIIPMYLLSKFTKQYVTVALGGDGGDELFAGYPTFQAEKLFRFYTLIPKFIRRTIIEPLINNLPVSDKNFSLDFKLKRFINVDSDDAVTRHKQWLSAFNAADRKKLLKPDVWQAGQQVNSSQTIDSWKDPGNKLLNSYLDSYLLDEVLVKVDRASMMASLETRSPLLDYTVVDFVYSLPYRYKLRGLKTKYVLKKLMTGKLPSDIINRSKKGFGIPLARWLQSDLREWCDETLSRENIEKLNLFNYDYVAKLKAGHFSGVADNRKQLWTLLVFCLWAKKWLNY